MNIKLYLCTGLILIFTFIGCSKTDKVKPNGNLKIVATTGMIGDAVKVITDGNVNLTTLMGPGVDPHLYKTTKSDMDNLAGADIIFFNGLHLEAKMAEILHKMSSSKNTVPVARSIDTTLLRYPDVYQGVPDPHIWFDISLWKLAVTEIGEELIKVDSSNASVYRKNLDAYQDSLTSLHNEIIAKINTIPESQRILVTAHDAFGYFGRAYQIKVDGLQGMSTVSEAGLYDVTEMIDYLVENKIKAVFVESSVPKKAIEAVVEGCNNRNHEIIIGGELFSDAMGTEGTPEGTYLGMVRHNVNTIVNALK
ncbi:MAG: manganese transporter [Calditrichaeota bacterium]|nr:MAG: manganese transporter [Calditrichota bacterium]